MDLRLYDYPPSGNCLKVRILLGHLGHPYERIETDIFGGDTLTQEYADKNPARRTPLLEADGVYLPESSAILWFLAEGSPYLPANPLGRARALQWLLFEQERVGAIAAVRFRLHTGSVTPEDPIADKMRAAGRSALASLEAHLTEHMFLVNDRYSIADIANYCYTHVADDAGIDLGDYPMVESWLRRIEGREGFVNDLAPLPETARVGRGLSIYG
jgi:glutathione S-transferase